MKLSVVISTRNRAPSLERTLQSVKDVADEIVVVDNESTDETKYIAGKFTKKVFVRPNNLMLNVNKNFGFTKAVGDWILCLDDDEVVPTDLAREIREKIANARSEVVGFWIPRKNIIFGKWITHGLWWPDRQLRLFRKGMGKFPEKHVHEYLEVTGRAETLTLPYIHYNYDSIDQFLDKMKIYVASEVQKQRTAGYTPQWWDAIRFPLSDFVKVYLAQEGYKDGLHGLVLSLLQAFYSFIVFAQLWERAKFPEMDIGLSQVSDEMRRSHKEVRYWLISAKLSSVRDPLTKLWYKLLRRFT